MKNATTVTGDAADRARRRTQAVFWPTYLFGALQLLGGMWLIFHGLHFFFSGLLVVCSISHISGSIDYLISSFNRYLYSFLAVLQNLVVGGAGEV